MPLVGIQTCPTFDTNKDGALWYECPFFSRYRPIRKEFELSWKEGTLLGKGTFFLKWIFVGQKLKLSFCERDMF